MKNHEKQKKHQVGQVDHLARVRAKCFAQSCINIEYWKSRKAGKPKGRKTEQKESRKAGKQESRKAGKPESRKAGKQESRKAGKEESTPNQSQSRWRDLKETIDHAAPKNRFANNVCFCASRIMRSRTTYQIDPCTASAVIVVRKKSYSDTIFLVNHFIPSYSRLQFCIFDALHLIMQGVQRVN